MTGRGVTVDFNANVARFTSGIDKATNDLAKFQSNTDRVSKNINTILGSIGVGLSTAGIVAFGKSVIDNLDKLSNLNKTTGLAVNTLAGLGVAARQSGADLDSVAASVSKLSVNIAKDADKFRALGISAKDPLEAFKQLADIYVAIKDPQERAAVAAAALGKSWQEVAPLLAEGGAAIGRMVSEGEKSTGVTKEMADAANKFNAQLEGMKARFSGVSVSIIGEFLPAMNTLLERFQSAQKTGVFGFFTASNEEETNAQKTIDGLKNKVESLRKLREELTAPTLANKLNNTLLGSLLSGGVSDVKTIDNQIFAIQKKITYLQGLVKSANEVAGEADKPTAAPSKKAIADFIGSNSEANAAAKALAERQKNFIESLQKEAATLGMTSSELKVYEAGLLKITGVKLDGVKADALRVENFKQEQEAAQKSRDAYAEAADSYLKFINATAADNRAAADKLDRLKVELGLLDKTEAERKRILGLYDLEIKFKERLRELDGLDTGEAVRQIQIANLEKEKAAQAEVIRFEEQLDTQKQKAGEMQKVWDNFGFNVQRNLGDQLFNILDGNFKNIGSAWKSMLLRMVSDAAAAQISKALFSTDMLKAGLSILGSIFGGFGGGGGGAGTGSQLRVTAPGSTGFAAKGAYFDGNVAKFALGGIVNSPTPFRFADGGAFRAGLMGEAGPEAIMPLKRDSAGRLGVAGGRSASINYAPVINIDSRTDRSEVHAIVSRAVKQGNADLVDKLNRQGVI